MANQRKKRLCGGTFLVLLLDAKGKRQATRKNGRKGDGRNNPDVFEKLLKLTIPDFIRPTEGRTFNTFTTEYKNCRESDTPSACLTDAETIRLFDNRVRNKYQEVAIAFDHFVKYAIDVTTHGERLVASLLDLIAMDEISDSQEFYIRPDGTPVCRTAILNEEQYHLSSFILGIWHYIVCNVTNNESDECKDTIEYLLGPKGEARAGRDVNCGIGLSRSSEISVVFDLPYNKSDITDDEDDLTDICPSDKVPVILGADGVAPDLANLLNGDIYLVDRVLLDDDAIDEAFGNYLKKASTFYSTVKTLLYSESPRNFKDFYVPNDVKAKYVGAGNNLERLTTPITELIGNPFNNLIIKGTGGIGKSMMMRYLFLYFAEHYTERGILPIFVPLKNYTGEDKRLEDFVFRSILEFDRDIDFDDFDAALNSGKCLILLDGWDEVPSTAKSTFDNALVNFKKAYHNNYLVVSSRPTSTFIQLGAFQILEIEPFSKEKALELIDKLDYHDTEVKEKFRQDLDKKLYRSHQQFASIPLLLTIMLMTYNSYGEVPAKRHIFYSKAYETMARLHDASKGAYVRPMYTKLSPDDFAVYFAEFCARTYRAEVLEFTAQIFTGYMNKVFAHQRMQTKATARDFLLDLTDNLCIMYKEGEKYYFIHRSFQEYFSAVFFSNQMDDHLERIGDFFEHQRTRMQGDRTFDMLYDMIPDRIDRYIFLPFLNNLWARCDADNGYWTFLKEMYPTIFAQEGEPGEFYENDPESYLYNFIVNETLHRHNGELYNVKWPDVIDYCNRKEWVSILKEHVLADGEMRYYSETMELDDVDDEYIYENGEPDLEGISWEIEISELLKRPDKFQELIVFMESDDFPLKKEYNEMRKFTEWLDKTINSKPSSDDWFDAF